jgi:hypothetical protein
VPRLQKEKPTSPRENATHVPTNRLGQLAEKAQTREPISEVDQKGKVAIGS